MRPTSVKWTVSNNDSNTRAFTINPYYFSSTSSSSLLLFCFIIFRFARVLSNSIVFHIMRIPYTIACCIVEEISNDAYFQVYFK